MSLKQNKKYIYLIALQYVLGVSQKTRYILTTKDKCSFKLLSIASRYLLKMKDFPIPCGML